MKRPANRVATAALFVAVMLGGLYGGRHTFFLLFGAIAALCLWEFFAIVIPNDKRGYRARLALGMALGMSPYIFAALYHFNVVGQWENFIAATGILFFPFVFLAFIHELYARSPQPFANVAFLVLGMVYIGVPFAMLHFIAFQGEHFHADTVLGLLLLTWSNDTAAYLVGSRFGHRLFFPRISPKKTWEGFLGAAAITLLAAWPISRLFSDPALRHWLALAVIVVVFGTVGDLVESMLKRSFARKDSGILLPGHGGMLDRFDAFIFLLPYATAYLLWIR